MARSGWISHHRRTWSLLTAACLAWGGVPEAGAALRADYRFQGDLRSVVGTAPPLRTIGTGTGFAATSVEGQYRPVLSFPAGGGVELPRIAGVLKRDVYTIAFLARLDEEGGWRRLLDLTGGRSNHGLYGYQRNLRFHGLAGGSGTGDPLRAGRWVQVVLVRSGAGLLAGYADGVRQFSLNDASSRVGVVRSRGLSLFRDDGRPGREESAGAIARLRIWDTPLSPAAVAALDRLPTSVTAGPHRFQPDDLTTVLGATVTWEMVGESHTVTDGSGLGLYDSGSIPRGRSFSLSFPWAGSYPYVCSLHSGMHGRIAVPPRLSSWGTEAGTPVRLTWGSLPPPAGTSFEVQVLRPGSSSWEDWVVGAGEGAADFSADGGPGWYQFRARLREDGSGDALGYSPPADLLVR